MLDQLMWVWNTLCKKKNILILFICVNHHALIFNGDPRSLVANMLGCNLKVSRFKLQIYW